MEVYRLLNLVILTLTATTILLTLVSYLLYKLRQLPGIQARQDGSLKINGVFFKRYVPQKAPRLRDLPVVVLKTAVAKGAEGASKILPKGIVGFFAALACVLFASLLIAGYLNRISLSGIRPRASDYKELRKAGLLKTYDFARVSEIGLLDEALTPPQKSRERDLVDALSRREIALLSLKGGQDAGPWREFLKRSGVPFRSAPRVTSVRAGELLIAPRIGTLSAGQLSALKDALARGASVLATGISYDSAWMRETFGLELLPHSDPDHPSPTVFAADSPPFWDLPPGLLLDWFPLENRYEATAVRGASAAFEASQRGLPRAPAATRAQFLDHGATRSAWLAFGPETLKATGEAEELYGRLALLSSIAWAARLPQARVATWKGGRSAAFVVSVDGEEQLENIRGLAALFREHRMPSTFFPYSDLLRQSPALGRELTEEIEVGSHGESAGSLAGGSVEARFDSLQQSRHEIEEIARRPVVGFRPPAESCDERTIGAAIQNRFAYVFGDQRFFRLAPLWIGGGRLLFIPRVSADDHHVHKRKDLETPEEIAAYLVDELERIGDLNGAYFLSLHTQVFGQSPYRQPLRLLLEQVEARKPWITRLGELADWWRTRDAIDATLAADGERDFELRIVNRGPRAAEGVSVRLDAPGAGGSLELHGDASPAPGDLSLGEDGIWALQLGRIDPGQELRYRLKRSAK